jgi:hypothetical protein
MLTRVSLEPVATLPLAGGAGWKPGGAAPPAAQAPRPLLCLWRRERVGLPGDRTRLGNFATHSLEVKRARGGGPMKPAKGGVRLKPEEIEVRLKPDSTWASVAHRRPGPAEAGLYVEA